MSKLGPKMPSIKPPKASGAPKVSGDMGPIKVAKAHHTIARPRLHRQHMQGLGKSAFASPGRSQAFNDPEASSGPGQAFAPDMMSGAAPGGGAPQGGPPEPAEPDTGAESGM